MAPSKKKRCVKFCPTRNKSIANSSSRCLHNASALQNESYRAIIDEVDFHHRAKNPRFHPRQMFAQFRDEMLVEWNRLLRTRRLHEIWTPPFARVAVKRELRNHQRREAQIFRRQIHFPRLVREDAKLRAF